MAEETSGNVGQCSRLCREAEKACLGCSHGVMRGTGNRAGEVTPESCARYAWGLLKQIIAAKCQSGCMYIYPRGWNTGGAFTYETAVLSIRRKMGIPEDAKGISWFRAALFLHIDERKELVPGTMTDSD